MFVGRSKLNRDGVSIDIDSTNIFVLHRDYNKNRNKSDVNIMSAVREKNVKVNLTGRSKAKVRSNTLGKNGIDTLQTDF